MIERVLHERLFDQYGERLFVRQPQTEHLFPERVFDPSPERVYAAPHV
jgi:hypothetical protein